MRRALGTIVLGSALLSSLLAPVALSTEAAYADVPPVANPPIEQSCGLELTLVLDASGSVSSSHAVDDVRDAGDALLTALKDTNSFARVSQFASLSQSLAGRTIIDEASMADGGALAEALQAYYNPIPPRPSDVNIYSFRGSGNPQSASSFSSANSSNQYTNWDQAIDQADTAGSELVVFVTDGDPTGYDFNQPGDPFRDQDVAVNTNRGEANQLTMDRAIEEANAVKAGDTRMLAVGVGSALNNAASRDRLTQIAGPQVVRDADLASVDDLNDIDVALVTDFQDLAQFMRGLVLQLCSPSLTVRKLAQTADDSIYRPLPGRDITVTPTVPEGDGFDWILPAGATGPSQTVPTDDNGFAQFQWEPIPPEEDSTATVAEATDDRYTPGRPGPNNDFRCELRNEAGQVRVVEDDFTDPANPSFELDPIGQEIVTCTLYNSFDYEPQIGLTKLNAPTEVRGDLHPPTEVTSSYEVTNPGNTPLSDIGIVDNRCGPVQPVVSGAANVGDVNQDGLLDPGETWQFTCTQPVQVSVTRTPGGQNITNTATVSGIDPAGTLVTATAADDVDVFTPLITLDKRVNGADQATISTGETADYTYDVTNAGNTPLGTVSLTDDTPPCQNPTLVDDGDGDAVLGLGESWTYSCSSSPDDDVVNTADVVATPLNPVTGDPFPDPNPTVTATDSAAVVVVTSDLNLTKAADPTVVLLDPGSSPPAEPVSYTFQATNGGDTPLARPGGGSTDPGWLQDPYCLAPATLVDGDTDGDTLLDVGETWTFTCDGAVSATTLNIATLTGQPTDADGTPLPVDPITAEAVALVKVQQPNLAVTKSATTPVVLDPDAPAVDGPDTPTPRQATYRYEVSNPGDVPLSLAGSLSDDTCAPLEFVDGDTSGNDLLDPGEVWTYRCQATLERQDAAEPPGDLPADVENTVTVTGTPLFNDALVPDKQVTDDANAHVTVIEPSLDLTKTASAPVVRNGSSVTYTVTIANTGTSGLKPTELADDKCALVYQSGDTDEDGILDGADTTPETWTFTCTRTIELDSAGDTDINTATVQAVDELGNTYADEDSATVRVVSPAIELTKAVDQDLVPAGTSVTYTFEVRNVGTSDIAAEDALDEVVLVDLARPPLAPECSSPDLIEKRGGNQDDVLERDPPEVWVYQCSSPISRPTTNLGVVEAVGGRPVGLEFRVGDFASARVEPFHPGIDVVKSAAPTRIVDSGEVTYTYRVTNTGDVPLAGVGEAIADDTCSPVEYVSGDLDGDGLLDSPDSIFEDAADETWVFRCSTVVDEDTTNTVVASGTPADQDGGSLCAPDTPCDPSDQDSAQVTVVAGPSPTPSPSPTPTPSPSPEPGPGAGPGPGPGPSAGGTLGDTGSPPLLPELLALGVLLLVAGGSMVVASRRRDPKA